MVRQSGKDAPLVAFVSQVFRQDEVQRIPASRDGFCLLPGSTNTQAGATQKSNQRPGFISLKGIGHECGVPTFCGRRSIASRWRPHRRARFKICAALQHLIRSVTGLLRRRNQLRGSKIGSLVGQRRLDPRSRPRSAETPTHSDAESRVQSVPVLSPNRGEKRRVDLPASGDAISNPAAEV